MTSIHAKVKRWGNSLAFIIPTHIAEAGNISENDDINVIVVPDSRKALRKTFGIGKKLLTKSGRQVKDELRSELYND
ncbi:MAG TPA: AbrB/MazE/SpoVT family DNA-binding domain-containing protein [Candidatus Nanoarchaeia archaeon]|nr:AbrB/MazE/SpoVT family DNA-binding domain-containing protein [Candidatus Nanoarchaeia archaeon]